MARCRCGGYVTIDGRYDVDPDDGLGETCGRRRGPRHLRVHECPIGDAPAKVHPSVVRTGDADVDSDPARGTAGVFPYMPEGVTGFGPAVLGEEAYRRERDQLAVHKRLWAQVDRISAERDLCFNCGARTHSAISRFLRSR
jgi:hypothetical protein